MNPSELDDLFQVFDNLIDYESPDAEIKFKTQLESEMKTITYEESLEVLKKSLANESQADELTRKIITLAGTLLNKKQTISLEEFLGLTLTKPVGLKNPYEKDIISSTKYHQWKLDIEVDLSLKNSCLGNPGYKELDLNGIKYYFTEFTLNNLLDRIVKKDMFEAIRFLSLKMCQNSHFIEEFYGIRSYLTHLPSGRKEELDLGNLIAYVYVKNSSIDKDIQREYFENISEAVNSYESPEENFEQIINKAIKSMQPALKKTKY